MKKIVLEILACPDCKSKVNYDDTTLDFECSQCGRKYGKTNGIPVLFSQHSRSVSDAGRDFYVEKTVPSESGWIKRISRNISNLSHTSIGRTLHDRLKDEHVLNAPEDSLILNLGSGIDNILMKDNVINFDIFSHPNTDVSGDGHFLPFLSDSFNIVWLCAVIEHLENPFQAATEIYRVLKPGGYVLVAAPFMYHLHGSPHDYFRYTDSGLRTVFKEFNEVECGPTHTLPTGTLIEIFSQYISIFFDNKIASSGVRLLTRFILSPLRIIDIFLMKKSMYQMLSGGFVFLGFKRVKE